ncbi:MAG TPA: biopolymer transporter ExbD [Bacteroidia bacterium]|jgi:biopolymer transport protein ExbD|nr:biopolymer transporter ExbD [Bacteroidia bacterium]
MNLKRNRKRFEAEVGASSMSDIMFFLMLFFLIVSTLVNPSVIKLMLPKASSAQSFSKKSFSLEMSLDKQYSLDGQRITFEEIEPKLTAATTGIDEPTVVLRIDNGLSVQDLVDVLAIGNKLKVKMIMATQAPK